jgi:alkanesulfonate monooxygenase SsuD/methylene tetrahydromethanopterin reductase-like flavin-dependent oxidoreductase (luciferase family)
MAGPRAIREHVTPRIRSAAEAAGRPEPRVCVGLPATVCDDEGMGRRAAAESYERYGRLVNYRRILDVEDVEGPSEVAVVGNESSLRSQLEAFADAGATDFIANIFTAGDDAESNARTYTALKDLVGKV